GFYTAVVGDDEFDANVNAAKACPVKIIKVEKVK
ncbi:MAG TPA: ferredoxin, partial [Vicingus sp.]|nr:ferredoxin [Vicingus sp.]